MASILEPGQFDDAPEDTVPLQDTRPDHAYIDTIDANDLDIDEEGEDIDEEDDSDYYDESYETRVEDEDWENAERGLPYSYAYCSTLDDCRLYEAIQPSTAARRCQDRQCGGNDVINIETNGRRFSARSKHSKGHKDKGRPRNQTIPD